MTEIIPEAMKHPDPASGLTASGRPVTASAADTDNTTGFLASPSPRGGQSAYSLPVIPADPCDPGTESSRD
jgi:hypothetical protein